MASVETAVCKMEMELEATNFNTFVPYNSIKITVLWDVTLFSPVDRYQHFRETCSPNLQDKRVMCAPCSCNMCMYVPNHSKS
jgi:hypothetical protein